MAKKDAKEPKITHVRLIAACMLGDNAEMTQHLHVDNGAVRGGVIDGKPYQLLFDEDPRFVRVSGGWKCGDALIPIANVANILVQD